MSSRWLIAEYRHQLKIECGGDGDGNIARTWKASNTWKTRCHYIIYDIISYHILYIYISCVTKPSFIQTRFYKRNKIALRKKTNNHGLDWSEREPRLQRYLASLQRRLQQSGDKRFPKWKRVSLDQVQCM